MYARNTLALKMAVNYTLYFYKLPQETMQIIQVIERRIIRSSPFVTSPILQRNISLFMATINFLFINYLVHGSKNQIGSKDYTYFGMEFLIQMQHSNPLLYALITHWWPVT